MKLLKVLGVLVGHFVSVPHKPFSYRWQSIVITMTCSKTILQYTGKWHSPTILERFLLSE